MKIAYDLPDDVRNYVLAVQGKKKVATGRGQISQQEVISDIIREHKKFTEELHESSGDPTRATGPRA